MAHLRCPAREAPEALAAVPHKRFQDVLAGHWHVDADGAIDGRSVCWLYCWAKTGMGSLKAAEAAQAAFDQVWAPKGWVLVDADPTPGLPFVPEPATVPRTPETVRSRNTEKPEG